MADLRAALLELRGRLADAMPPRREDVQRLDEIVKLLDAQVSQLARVRQDVADAEHARDAANLARMRVVGQLNTLHKTIRAATPGYDEPPASEAQHQALRRIEWLMDSRGIDPKAAIAAREAEMEAPIPGLAVLQAVMAGARSFSKDQLEFSVAEAMVLTGWEMTPIELLAKGEPWLARLIADNHESAPDSGT